MTSHEQIVSVISFLIAGALLLLLVVVVMWENVASVPRCLMKEDGCQKILRYMFNRTSTTSETISRLSLETLNEFVSPSLTLDSLIKRFQCQ